MLTVIIRSGIYNSSPSKKIELSTLRWLAEKHTFEFTVGISDGFYETSLTPSVKVTKLAFKIGAVEIFVESEQAIQTLAAELIEMDQKCNKSMINVRM